MALDLRGKLLKRNPFRGEVSLVQSVNDLYPVGGRNVWVQGNAAAGGALITGGGVYFPPQQGGLVKWAFCTPDAGASGWRFGLAPMSVLAGGSASLSAAAQRPLWNVPLAGQVESWNFFGIGDLCGTISQGVPAPFPTGGFLVRPPLVFIVALTVDNLVAEWSMYIEEAVSGNEDV